MGIVHHYSVESRPSDRGSGMGRAHSAAVHNTVRTYRRLFHEVLGLTTREISGLGARVGDLLARRRPALLDEIEGIALGARCDLTELLAVNARTELLGSRFSPECSAVGLTTGEASGGVLAQNWDWHPDLRGSRLIWHVNPPRGCSFTSLTEAGMLAKLGMNGHGIACTLNRMVTTRDTGEVAMPIHCLIRLLLQSCEQLSQAFALLAAETVGASSCITVAHWDGSRMALAAVELSPGGMGVVPPNADGLLVHTNHFLQPPRTGRDLLADPSSSSVRRRANLQSQLSDSPTQRADVEALFSSHDGGPHAAVCVHASPEAKRWSDRYETLASVVMEPALGAMWITDGPPCRARYDAVVPPWRTAKHGGRA